jgi:uncharacterized protein (DUF2384 family)
MTAMREATAIGNRAAEVWDAVLAGDLRALERCTPLDRVMLLRSGVPTALIPLVVEAMGITREQLYETVGLARSTGDRKLKKGQSLEIGQAEALLEMARLIGQVERMLEESGDPDRPDDFSAARWFAGWLYDPLPALGGRTPAELMDTAEGRSVISRLLLQMQSGAYA